MSLADLRLSTCRGAKEMQAAMDEKLRHNSMMDSTVPPESAADEVLAPIAEANPMDSGASADGEALRGRREFLGKSGKLLIYVPPVIQLFIPTKALAASPSS
ncbi:MAG: hypothetical protein R3E58_16890 [Phycisphaerae bacterium]